MMRRSSFAGLFGFVLSIALGALPPANTLAAVTEQEAHAIGVDAYLYFYPLVTMDITRKQSTNIEPGKELGKGPMNMFSNLQTYPPADFRGVVRPAFSILIGCTRSLRLTTRTPVAPRLIRCS